MEREADIKAENHMGFGLLTPLTARGRRWVERNVHAEPWQWIGGSLAAEGDYLDTILDAALADGLDCTPIDD